MQVYDVLIKHEANKFSYKQPPPPHFSIAMMHNGCSNLPCLDEILDLSLTVAATPAAAKQASNTALTATEAADDGGSSSSSGRPLYQAVKFALPEEGDVNFCELVPMRPMNLLTNQ